MVKSLPKILWFQQLADAPEWELPALGLELETFSGASDFLFPCLPFPTVVEVLTPKATRNWVVFVYMGTSVIA